LLALASTMTCTPFDWGLPPTTPQTAAEAAHLAEEHPDLAALTFALGAVDLSTWDCGANVGVRRYVRGVLQEKLVHAGLRVQGDPRNARVVLIEHRFPSPCFATGSPSEWSLAVRVDGVLVDKLAASCTAAEAGGDACNPMDKLVDSLLHSPKLGAAAARISGAAPSR